jgi:hypothetical protein
MWLNAALSLLGVLACAVVGTRAAVEADPNIKTIPVSQSLWWHAEVLQLSCTSAGGKW